MFKSTNSELSLGYGRSATVSTSKTGIMDKFGMFYGRERSVNTGIKLFGLEDFLTYRGLICPGLYLDSNKTFRFIDIYDPNSSYDPAYISNYISDPNITDIANTSSSQPSEVIGTTEVGFFGVANKSCNVSTDYFCDYTYCKFCILKSNF